MYYKDTNTIPLNGNIAALLQQEIKQTAAQGKPSPAFPCVFPPELENIIDDIARGLGFNRDYLAASVLTVAAVAIGNKYAIEPRTGEIQSPIIWTGLAGGSGVGKTPTINYAIGPLSERDRFLNDQRELEKAEKKRLHKEWKDSKASTPEPDTEPPPQQKHVFRDTTSEAVMRVMYEHEGGKLLLKDEFIELVKDSGSGSSRGGDTERLMTMHSGGDVTVDRKGAEPLYIRNSMLCIIGGVQNGILSQFASNGRNVNGFVFRILFALQLENRISPWTEVEINAQTTSAYHNIINRLLDMPQDYDDAGHSLRRVVRYSLERNAKAPVTNWINQSADEINECGDDTAAAINGKMRSYVHRFALILQLLRYACGEDNCAEVGAEAAAGAVELAKYFTDTAMLVQSIIKGERTPTDGYGELVKQFYASVPEEFTTEEGWEIASKIGIKRRTYERLISRKSPLFPWKGKGIHCKAA